MAFPFLPLIAVGAVLLKNLFGRTPGRDGRAVTVFTLLPEDVSELLDRHPDAVPADEAILRLRREDPDHVHGLLEALEDARRKRPGTLLFVDLGG